MRKYAIILSVVAVLCIGGAFILNDSEDVEPNTDSVHDMSGDIEETTEAEGAKLMDELEGTCWQNNDEGTKTVVYFTDKTVQFLTDPNTSNVGFEEYEYELSGDGKQIILDSEGDNMSRAFEHNGNSITIINVKYTPDDWNNYSN